MPTTEEKLKIERDEARQLAIKFMLENQQLKLELIEAQAAIAEIDNYFVGGLSSCNLSMKTNRAVANALLSPVKKEQP